MKKLIPFFIGLVVGMCLLILTGYLFLKNRITTSSGNETVSEQVYNSTAPVKIIELSVEDFLKMKDTISNTTLVNFWATWCKSCIEEMPFLIDYCKTNHVNLIMVSIDRNNEKQKALLKVKMQKLNIPVSYIIKESSLTDLTNKEAMNTFAKGAKIDFNNTGIPFFVAINKKGSRISQFAGLDRGSIYKAFFDSKLKEIK